LSQTASMWITIFLTLIPLSFHSGCATLKRVHEPAHVPVVFQPIFLNCSPMDRDAVLTVKKSGSRVFTSDMVWSIPDSNSAEIQFNSLLGDTVLHAQRRLPKWNVSGTGNLEISESIKGIVSINGFELPILGEEVGCILAGTWPSAWLRQLFLRDSTGSSLSMVGADDFRDFEVAMTLAHRPQSARSDDIQSCAMLKWGGFLGIMGHKVSICREQTSEGLRVSLSGINDYLIEWVIQNES